MQKISLSKSSVLKPASTRAAILHCLPGMEVLETRRASLHFDRRARAEYTIMLVNEGTERFFHRGSSWAAPKGGLVLINPGEMYGNEALQETRSYTAIYPSPELLRNFLPLRPAGLLVFRQPVVDNAVAALRFSELLKSVFSAHTPLGLQCKFAELMAEIALRYTGVAIEKECHEASNAVKRVRERIQDAPAETVTLPQLAGEVGMEPLALLRAFQRSVGCTPHIFQVSQRLRLAKNALQAGGSIIETAVACGFVDQSHFTNTFRRWTGITPAQYVRSIRSA